MSLKQAIDTQDIQELEKIINQDNINLEKNHEELDFSPVLYASRYNKANVIDLFLRLGADLITYDRYYDTSSRIQAAVHNSIDVLRIMHDRGIDIISNESSTLFHVKISYIAIEYGALETVKFFHELGEDFSKKETIGDFCGTSGVELAVQSNKQNVVEFFNSIGCETDKILDEHLQLCISFSMDSWNIDSTKQLILKGAQVTDACFNFMSQKIKKGKARKKRKIFVDELLAFCLEEQNIHYSYIYVCFLINSKRLNISNIQTEIKDYIGYDSNIAKNVSIIIYNFNNMATMI